MRLLLWGMLSLYSIHSFAEPGRESIRLSIKGVQPGDSVFIVTEDFPLKRVFKKSSLLKHGEYKNGQWRFNVDALNDIIYITVYKSKTGDNDLVPLLTYYIAEAGDDIKLKMDELSDDGGKPIIKYIEGKGSRKYQARYSLERYIDETLKALHDRSWSNRNALAEKTHRYFTAYIEKNMEGLSNRVYELMRADICAMFELNILLRNSNLGNDTSWQADSLRYYERLRQIEIGLTRESKDKSAFFYRYILEKENLALQVKKLSGKAIIPAMLSRLRNNYTCELRDKVLTAFILERYWSNSIEEVWDSVMIAIDGKEYEQILSNHAQKNFRGNNAYNFSLPDLYGHTVELKHFKGKVVFIDYWFTGCSACVAYYNKALSIAEKEFLNNDNVVFVSINASRTREKWMEGVSSGKYTSEKAWNLYASDVSPVLDYYNITGYPHRVLIDRDGKIFSNDKAELGTSGKLINMINKALNKK